MATLRPATLRGAGVGARAPSALRSCRGAVRHAARAQPRAAAVKGLDALSPPGTADLTLFSPSKARARGAPLPRPSSAQRGRSG
jgi:hypothetical protein